MFHVGLTGNVASGKSVVAQHFAAGGATVIAADQIVHDLQRPGSHVLAAIVQRFGSEVLLADGSLDRAALRARAMGHAGNLAALNAIVHPAVHERRSQLLREARARGTTVVVSEIPLLFEVLDPGEFDMIVLVHASRANRRQRLVEQRRLAPEEAEAMLDAQLPSESKREKSDIVIENDGSLAELEARAQEAWRTIQDLATQARKISGREATEDHG